MKLRAAPLLLLLLCGPLGAEDVTPKLAAELFATAYGQYGGSPTLLDSPPQVVIVSQDDLCILMSEHPGCDYSGAYAPVMSKIFVSKLLDFAGVDARALLIHEFVHHLQERECGPVPSKDPIAQCKETARREKQAYGIQADVLEKAGLPDFAQNARNVAEAQKCPKE